MRVRAFEHDGSPMKNCNFKANICARHVRIDVKNENNERKNANSSTTQTYRTKALKRVKNVVNKIFFFALLCLLLSRSLFIFSRFFNLFHYANRKET